MISITIGGVDYSQYVDRSSYRHEQVLTAQPDNLKLVLRDAPTKPALFDVVEVHNDAALVFSGKVLKIGTKTQSLTCLYEIEAKDWTIAIDGTQIVNTYEGKTVDYIIADILTDTEITNNNVDCQIVIDYIKFDYEQPSVCFQRLAELVGYDWYIDYEKDMHFFIASTEPAAFNLNDSSDNYRPDSLSITEDSSQIRNLIFVEGGEYLGDSFTEEIVADGDQKTFNLAYKYKNLTATVGGISKTIGIDFIDDAADYDALHNFEQKVLKFRDDNKPTAGQAVAITGNPYIPVLIRFEESSSMTQYGVRSIRIIDKTIKTKDAAKERAKAEVRAYKNAVSEGAFETWTDGLRAGQSIYIDSDLRGIHESYIISKVITTMESSTLFKYQITLVSQRTYDILSFLQALMDTKNISDDRDKVLQKIYNVSDTVVISGSITKEAASEVAETITVTESVRTITPIWVAGRYVPTSPTDYKRTPIASRGAEVQS